MRRRSQSGKEYRGFTSFFCFFFVHSLVKDIKGKEACSEMLCRVGIHPGPGIVIYFVYLYSSKSFRITTYIVKKSA